MQPEDGYSRATLGRGEIVLAEDLQKTLAALGVRREEWSRGEGLRFHRRTWDGGQVYFIKNDSPQPLDDRIELTGDFVAAAFMDPLSGRIGLADVGAEPNTLRLQLDPGQAIFVKTYQRFSDAPAWNYREPAGEPMPLDGLWAVEFIEGGPKLPPPFNTQRLASWTELAGAESERFAGTARYTTRFTPDVAAQRYLLDLGQVADSARVEMNGKPVATLFGPPYRVEIGPLLAENNVITVEVTNAAANRIRDLDRRGVKWRNFKDINFVDINYRPFDASNWPVRDAGLLGPVTIAPLAQ